MQHNRSGRGYESLPRSGRKFEGFEIRRADPADMAGVVELCSKHAAHERMNYDPAGKRETLTQAIFEASKLICIVAATSQRHRSGIAGYATCMSQYSTWLTTEYLYMDCLYVEAECRGFGIGKRLMQAVAEEAVKLGYAEVQWQTPDFNEQAKQFYDSVEGTSRYCKSRYTWQL